VMIQVKTKIGSRTKIMDSCHLPGDMIVEEDVFLSTHVCGASENSIGRKDMTDKWAGPFIAKGAYIGLNATLLPGIRIGENAVVAAASTVTKDVEPGTLVMGSPARFVRNVEPWI
jgi:acetyltransferase-like isoleucine patch superfamily enzyme